MLKTLKNKFKKGVSIVEVVIAIAVISIISVSAVSTLTYAKKAQEKNLRDYDLANTCNTVIDCFWVDKDNFWANISACDYIIENNTIKRESYTLQVEYDSDTLTLTAFDNNDTQFYQITYEGGA